MGTSGGRAPLAPPGAGRAFPSLRPYPAAADPPPPPGLDGSGEECVSGAGKARPSADLPLPRRTGLPLSSSETRRRRRADGRTEGERGRASRRAQPSSARSRDAGELQSDRRAGARPLPGARRAAAMAEVAGRTGRGLEPAGERTERCPSGPRGLVSGVSRGRRERLPAARPAAAGSRHRPGARVPQRPFRADKGESRLASRLPGRCACPGRAGGKVSGPARGFLWRRDGGLGPPVPVGAGQAFVRPEPGPALPGQRPRPGRPDPSLTAKVGAGAPLGAAMCRPLPLARRCPGKGQRWVKFGAASPGGRAAPSEPGPAEPGGGGRLVSRGKRALGRELQE